MTLHLVKPNEPRQKRRKGQRSPPVLAPDEEGRFRAAMRNLQGAFGSWPCLAKAMGAQEKAIYAMMKGTRHVSGDMIVRAMRASGLSFAELIGAPVSADRCRACGKVRAA